MERGWRTPTTIAPRRRPGPTGPRPSCRGPSRTRSATPSPRSAHPAPPADRRGTVPEPRPHRRNRPGRCWAARPRPTPCSTAPAPPRRPPLRSRRLRRRRPSLRRRLLASRPAPAPVPPGGGSVSVGDPARPPLVTPSTVGPPAAGVLPVPPPPLAPLAPTAPPPSPPVAPPTIAPPPASAPPGPSPSPVRPGGPRAVGLARRSRRPCAVGARPSHRRRSLRRTPCRPRTRPVGFPLRPGRTPRPPARPWPRWIRRRRPRLRRRPRSGAVARARRLRPRWTAASALRLAAFAPRRPCAVAGLAASGTSRR